MVTREKGKRGQLFNSISCIPRGDISLPLLLHTTCYSLYNRRIVTMNVSFIVWILVTSFQYGYHISALNQIGSVLTCRSYSDVLPSTTLVPNCVPMDDWQFSSVTSIFTIGGLLGSLFANRAIVSRGRLESTVLSASFVSAGSIIMSIAGSFHIIALSR